jgi:hypothetical protein
MKNSATVARVISRVFTYAWHWRGMLGEVAVMVPVIELMVWRYLPQLFSFLHHDGP